MITQTKLPYSGTKVDPETTKAEIIQLLKKYGIRNYQWTEYNGDVKLTFATEIEWRGKQTEMHCILRPPELKEFRKVWSAGQGRQVKQWVANWPVAYRLMKDHLKNRLALVSCGAYTFEDIFLQDLTILDQNTGEETRLADFMRTRGQIPGMMLPDKTEPSPKVISDIDSQ